jgi:hypothetical protein
VTGGEEWLMIRHMLACRSGNRCEICGQPLGAGREGSVHHRQPRGMGGTSDLAVHSLERLLLGCGGHLGGVLGCHGLIEKNRAWAYRFGYLVPHSVPGRPTPATDCAQVAVVLPSGRRVLLAPRALEYFPAPGPPYTDRPLQVLAAALGRARVAVICRLTPAAAGSV